MVCTVQNLINILLQYPPDWDIKICSDIDTVDYDINCIESGNKDKELIIYFSE